MKLAVMQPYFLPYIGYFQLINVADEWIVFDSIQYIRHGWVNRNRLLSPNIEKQWQYVSIPIIGQDRDTLIQDVVINNEIKWRSELFGKLSYYKQIGAPFYTEIISMLKETLDSEFTHLSHLNVKLLGIICKYLDISFKYKLCSEQKFDFSMVETAGDWAFEISKQTGAQEYINPEGGRDLFDQAKFEKAGIHLSFLSSTECRYIQSRREYVPWLSILDVLMFNSQSQIKSLMELNTSISS